MNSNSSLTWRVLFILGGLFYFVGSFFHPRGMTMSDMLVDAAWVPAHAAVFLGFILITVGLVIFRRSIPVSSALDRWILATIVLAFFQIIEMGLHTMAYVDAGALAHGDFHGGLSTPILTIHIWLSTIAFTPFAIAFLGMIWRGARERGLGSWWIIWIGVIGAVAYGSVMWLVFIFEVAGSGILFPIAHLFVPLWFILAGVWPSRRATGASGLM